MKRRAQQLGEGGLLHGFGHRGVAVDGVGQLFGPHMHNFNDAMEILRACSGSIEATRETLIPALERVLKDREESSAMATRARDGFLEHQGATARAVQCIVSYLRDKPRMTNEK